MKTIFNLLFDFFSGNSASKDYIGLSDFKKTKPLEIKKKPALEFEEKSSLTGLLKRV